ncbi:uncharacterized protein NECHADRAFT_66482 [Fusarium vanettenii 77-13-4]|uniref:Myb-like domain-containing protein n=1 Tax=Fusarium vanettenii (strain ATCC MYA-4622 / CBS 123669 / FGSC 9596 / NRRL 45880 / 77-13-4) TaxID=660122 RepID=C7Z4D4_FUSV7|nr:uncharacterized protein NECHADRAFT_66482 [Fusarium vanettenii 77-13-4]EEU40329.1 hypothetical protein NECHADRAFT_66482 [Fusarium vanettenii 77-13-4]
MGDAELRAQVAQGLLGVYGQGDGQGESDASGSIYSGDEIDTAEDDQQSSLKRPAEEDPAPRVFKRHKGVLNTDYLNLLNIDIKDAAQRVCVVDEEGVLDASQIGLTLWSTLEKKLFFEALARLGQGDLPGIASRIGTKSEVEVNHYLHVLQRAQLLRQREVRRSAIEFPEHPAAIELSQQCCHALEEAADAISVRQERKEEQREESKWGECWDITPKIARQLDNGENREGQNLPFSTLFHLPTWLGLSERIFMNSSIPSENWNFIDNNPPSMWATTFEDFHSLAVSITRRLVQTTIFLSMSRIRAKKEVMPSTRDIIRVEDVETAVVSLGLKRNSLRFWNKCARRLRLEVYNEPPSRDEEADQEALSYDQIESDLPGREDKAKRALEPSMVEDLSDLSNEEVIDDSDFETAMVASREEEAAINREAMEILQFSAADFPETYRKKESLKNRIATERRQEQYAEEGDQHVSRQAEAEMWDLLQKKPPIEMPKMYQPGSAQRTTLDVESIFPIGRDWRTQTRYRSEWESK